MQPDTQARLSPVSIALHWIVGVMTITLLAVGVYMEENEVIALYKWHKSFGVLILVFVMARVVWRIMHGWPPAASVYEKWEQLLSRIVHYTLIAGTLVMPISGFMGSSLGGYGVAFFGIQLVSRNPDPADPEKVMAINEALAGIAYEVHDIGGSVVILAIVLHLAGALKHHLVDGDGTLRRMLGGSA